MAISKFNYNSFNVTPVAGNALSFNSDADGFTTQGASSMILIKTLTASTSATLSFVDGSSDVVLDSTYPIYMFKYINCHPATNNAEFSVNFRDGSTDYDATKTTTVFEAYHSEDNSANGFSYQTGDDIAQGTGFQTISKNIGNNNDSSCSGELMLFNPSSTTFVKHFIGRSNKMEVSVTGDFLVAGYCNVTAAIDAVQFKMSSGNIDSGTIKLYGIKDS
jgi:hypothetical protein